MAEHTPPVPPDDSSLTINLFDHFGNELATKLIFEAGYKHAMKDQEELERLLMEEDEKHRALAALIVVTAPHLCHLKDIPNAEHVADYHNISVDKIKEAAERLRGGGE
jgi:hypothetical protein